MFVPSIKFGWSLKRHGYSVMVTRQNCFTDKRLKMDIVVFIKIVTYSIAIGYFVITLAESLDDIEKRNKDDDD